MFVLVQISPHRVWGVVLCALHTLHALSDVGQSLRRKEDYVNLRKRQATAITALLFCLLFFFLFFIIFVKYNNVAISDGWPQRTSFNASFVILALFSTSVCLLLYLYLKSMFIQYITIKDWIRLHFLCNVNYNTFKHLSSLTFNGSFVVWHRSVSSAEYDC